MAAEAPWAPTRILRVGQAFGSASRPVRVTTDAGDAFLKVMLEGEQQSGYLAKEWIGTGMARLIGLPTFDYAQIELGDVPEIAVHGGEVARPGPAFVTRSERGGPWGGSAKELRRVWNHADIAKLVVFDTWVLNIDRYTFDPAGRGAHFDNVFLSQEGVPDAKHRTLKATDHTHCLTGPWPLTEDLANRNRIESQTVYGLFPEFRETITGPEVELAAQCLSELEEGSVRRALDQIPPEWGVSSPTLEAVLELLLRRARFIADRIVGILWPAERTLFREGER